MTDEIVRLLSAEFDGLRDSNAQLVEELDLVKAQFAHLKAEDAGWVKVFGGGNPYEDTGISLETLKEVSKTLRQGVAGSSFPRRANDLRYSYTFGKPFIFPGVEQEAERVSKRGRPAAIQKFYDDPLNQRYAFSEAAQVTMNTATSTDGVYLFLGDDRKKTGRAIPIGDIEAIYLNPDFSDEIYAYMRSWTSEDESGKAVSKKEWYYTDRFKGTRQGTIKVGEEEVPVDRNKTIIDFSASPQVGWSLGIPDLMAAHIWNSKYLTLVAQGEEVTDVLATFAAKVKAQSRAGANQMGLKISNARRKGPQTMAYGEGNAIDVFQSLGRTYDWDGLRPIAAMYASAAGVSVVDLMASPAAAGASYGSAQALQPGERRSIEARREQWATWYERIFAWGTGEEIKVTAAPLDETDPYRKAQIEALVWNTGLVHADEARPELLKVAGITSRHTKAPDGVLLPNNRHSWERSDIDPKEDPNKTPSTAASPDQGVPNGSGGTDGALANDQRSDKVGESLRRMQDEEYLQRLEAVAERIEAAMGQ